MCIPLKVLDLFYFVYISVLPTCLYTTCVPGIRGGQKKRSELEMA